ncbi:hypothetical protein [Paenarthrobacter ureafaciens]|uniref:hypothetical protein n=1 Tax=Paenarthrobacter ureafaciens TaxID=37931 RepID=UPI001FB2D92E|nr:hypothetical protein [Paenarthrobacter ureafaciens]UOD80340.1 hypothetical protein MQZ73_14625 [Paenarthrobacter ureafaciens]WNZ02993.1 hypothetical protein PVT25_15265 [Paenarthrobacter ureafaciens]
MGASTLLEKITTVGGSDSKCGACGAPLKDGWQLCHDHTTILEKDLADIGGVWEDIMITSAKLDVGAPSVGGGTHTGSKAPANLSALDLAQALRVVIGKYASQLPILGPFGEPPAKAEWLLQHVPAIRKMEWAADFMTDLHDALNDCRYATDRAAERVSLGECGNMVDDEYCYGTMMSILGGRIAKCRTCGATDISRERQQWLISEAWHVQAFLPDIARWLTNSGHAKIDIKKARNWVNAGKLEPDACDVGTRRNLFTPAAVIAAYRETPTGRRQQLANAS